MVDQVFPCLLSHIYMSSPQISLIRPESHALRVIISHPAIEKAPGYRGRLMTDCVIIKHLQLHHEPVTYRERSK